jgi:D-3-phosphoglycerate dehydrogenase
MSDKILVTDYKWPNLDVENAILSEIGAQLVPAPDGEEDTLAELARGCRGIMTCWAETTRRVIEAALPDLEVIARYGIGLDNIDVDFATRRGVPIANVPTYCVIDVAEHTLSCILALSTKIAFLDRRIRQNSWSIQEALPMRRVGGKRLGLIGLGNIGRQVSALASAIGMEVVAFTPDLTDERARDAGAAAVSLEELLSTSDFVSLHAPLTEVTSRLMDTAAFSLMKSSAFLINASRGGLVHEADLLRALTDGEIAGAALDVRDPEPPVDDDPLRQLDNVIDTPHSSFYTSESIEELQSQTAWEVRRVFTGEEPRNLVNPDYRRSR